MGYRGRTYPIPFDGGGLTHNPNIDMNPDNALLNPSRNVNCHEGGKGKRGGTAHVNGSAVSGTPQIMGIHDFTLQSGTQYIVFATNDGKIYKNYTTTIKTGLSTDKVSDFTIANNKLFHCNGANSPQVWDGSAGSTSDITSEPTDWATYKPKQMVEHGYGNSTRMWAFGFVDGSVYASKDGDHEDFSDANVVKIAIYTDDGFGIVGGVEYGDRIFAFGKRRAYVIDDTDASSANWGYYQAQWMGGAASHRLIVKTPYDIICMMEDGEIYSVSAAESYGDYKAASLTRPAFMDRWIREFVNLAQIDKFHGIYDPVLRAVRFFVAYAGQTTIDTCLLYFIDRPLPDAWEVHDNQSYASGYDASCSALVRASVGSYKIYTGDYSGFVWELEMANKNDNANGYYGGVKFPHWSFKSPRLNKRFDQARIITQPEGLYNLTVDWWVDGVAQTQKTVSLIGTGGTLGSFTLGTDLLGGQTLTEGVIELGEVGKRLQMEFYNTGANEDFYLSNLLIDYMPLGGRPD